MPDLATYLIQHLSLSGTWLSVIPRMNLKDTCLQKIELCVENIITILGSILNLIERWGGDIIPFNKHENLHFKKE